MRRPTIVIAAGLLGAFVAAVPASAINSYNASPAPEHDEVGAFVALYERDSEDPLNPDRFRIVCSGTMVDDDTFLTAAHCTDDWPAGTRLFVSLADDVQALLDESLEGRTPAQAADYAVAHDYVVEATPNGVHQHADYPGNAAESFDIGVLDFAEQPRGPADIWDFEPATLPTLGQLSEFGPRGLDALAWTVMGYGTSEAQRLPGGHVWESDGIRLQAPEGFDALNPTWIRLSMIEAQGYGGACYGDSGGPNFATIDGELVLAGTTITGDVPCYATNVAYRMDTPSAIDFLAPFLVDN
jgi:hypothetical protein